MGSTNVNKRPMAIQLYWIKSPHFLEIGDALDLSGDQHHAIEQERGVNDPPGS
jgi:hypothetical protein